MEKSTGFSLTEVLVSLLLVSTIILALLRQQWQIAQWINQLNLQFDGMIYLDNQSERQSRHLPLTPAAKPFQLSHKVQREGYELDLYWPSIQQNITDCCHLVRKGLPIL